MSLDKTAVVISDMRTSMDYLVKAEPVIKQLLNGGEILPVEGSDDEVCKMLDLTCGIDYFHVYSNGLTWGIASRMQPNCSKGWNTFTVRMKRESGAKTEYEKRKFAIDHNGEYPFLTMQGYFDRNNNVISLAIAKTVDVMNCVENDIGYYRHTGQDKTGQAEFYVIPWDKMKQAGYKVLIYEREGR